eukprot:352478-Pleurochrysis_carterae.AAC.1
MGVGGVARAVGGEPGPPVDASARRPDQGPPRQAQGHPAAGEETPTGDRARHGPDVRLRRAAEIVGGAAAPHRDR